MLFLAASLVIPTRRIHQICRTQIYLPQNPQNSSHKIYAIPHIFPAFSYLVAFEYFAYLAVLLWNNSFHFPLSNFIKMEQTLVLLFLMMCPSSSMQ